MGHVHVAKVHILGSITVVDNSKISLGWITAHSPSMLKKSETVATVSNDVPFAKILLVCTNNYSS